MFSSSHRASERPAGGAHPITGAIPPMPKQAKQTKQFRRKDRLEEADLYYADTIYEPPSPDYFDFARHAGDSSALDGPPVGDRWSTWDQSTRSERGPEPHPSWLVTELAAVDTEHG